MTNRPDITESKPTRPLDFKPAPTYEQRLALYEIRKSQLSPELNHHEYSNACRDIARRCGV